MTARIPLTVIGGYLGAGKTTLVNHLLRSANGLRIAILVNDFGDLPIDADLIEAESEDLISIAGGCVCCSFGSDLIGALMKMATRIPAPDHLLIETSGVALPGTVARSAALIPAFAIDGVVVLADAETVQSRASDPYMGDTITRQLAEADLVVLNKTDLVTPGRLATIQAWTAAQASRASVIEAERGEVPIDVLFGQGRLRDGAGMFQTGSIRAIEDASERYESLSFAAPASVDVAQLALALADPRCGLVRAKGVLRDLDGSIKTLHVVGARSEVLATDDSSGTGLACIGLRGRLDRTRIEAAVKNL